MKIVELLYFTFLPFIPSEASLQIYSSETTNSLLFGSIRLGLNSIDGKINQLSSKISRGEEDIQFGKVTL